ncbi:unnamed protein product [Ectocarpus sp. 6 AP-2014]
MNNCYKPLAAPAQNDGKSKRRDRDGKAPNGTATKEPSLANTTREDGRAPYDMRQVYMDVGVVAHATGSAYVELNHTKVICAVYGPHAQTGGDSAFSEEGQLQCDFSYAPFAMPGGRRETRGGKKDDERELSTLLRQTLESSIQVHRLTKSVVGVHVMVLQADGGELAVATTCASMALADAGIELYDLVTACSVGYCGTQVRPSYPRGLPTIAAYPLLRITRLTRAQHCPAPRCNWLDFFNTYVGNHVPLSPLKRHLKVVCVRIDLGVRLCITGP